MLTPHLMFVPTGILMAGVCGKHQAEALQHISFALFSEENPENVFFCSPTGLALRQRHRIPHAQLTFSLNYIA